MKFSNKIGSSKEGKRIIKKLAGELEVELREWTKKKGLKFSKSVFLSTSYICVATMPIKKFKIQRFIMGKMVLWIFAIDDIFDGDEYSYKKLEKQAKIYRRCMWKKDPSEFFMNGIKDEKVCKLARVLVEIKNDLKEFELFKRLHGEWKKAGFGLLEGMLFEAYNRLYSRKVSFKEYMIYGRDTIGVPFTGLTMAISVNDKLIFKEFEKIKKMLYISGSAIRLANDLRSCKREYKNNKLNSVFILKEKYFFKKENNSLLLNKIKSIIKEEYERVRDVSALLSKKNQGNFGRLILQMTNFSIGVYGASDFIAIAKKDIKKIV